MSERIEIGFVVPGHSHFHNDVYAVMAPCLCGSDWTLAGNLLAVGCEAETWPLDNDPQCDQYGCTLYWTGDVAELVKRVRQWFRFETGCYCEWGIQWREKLDSERAGIEGESE